MLNLIIAQIGYKPAKKSDQDRTVFLKDSANHFFEANTGLGIDLTARLAEKWFADRRTRLAETAATLNVTSRDRGRKL